MTNSLNFKYYVGNPSQQAQVINKLVHEIRNRESGIFVVGGGGRVGKNTVFGGDDEKGVEGVVSMLGWEVDPGGFEAFVQLHVNDFCDDPNICFGSWEEAYKYGKNNFVFGEVAIRHEKSLEWLNRFYEKGIVEGRPIKILLNTITRTNPSWENEANKNDIQKQLGELFVVENVVFHFLESDPERIIRELWRLNQEGGLHNFCYAAVNLGFRGGIEIEMRLDSGDDVFEDEASFSISLRDIMGIEGNVDIERGT